MKVYRIVNDNSLFGNLDLSIPGDKIKFGMILKNHFRMNFSDITLHVADMEVRAGRQQLKFIKKGDKIEEQGDLSHIKPEKPGEK